MPGVNEWHVGMSIPMLAILTMDTILDSMSESTTTSEPLDIEARTMLSHCARSLSFQYRSGGSGMVHPPHSMGWRVMPFALAAQAEYSLALIVGERTIHTRGGEAIFVKQGARHHISLRGKKSGVSRYAHFNISIFGAIDLMGFFDVPDVFHGEDAERIGTINARMGVLNREGIKDLGSAIEQQSLGLSLIHLLVSRSRPLNPASNNPLGFQRLFPVLRHLSECLADPISLSDLAERTHLSPSRFHALFKSLTGQAPLYYVQRMRLERAQELLIETDQTVKEIAMAVGFADAFHFSRLFKLRLGSSPTAYREIARQRLFGMDASVCNQAEGF